MVLEHASVVRVEQQLRTLGIQGEVVQLPDAARTAAAAADQLGCAVGAIANSLIFNAADEPLLVMTSGAHRVDVVRVAGLLEVATLDRADADFVRQHTGMAIGGVAPVGFPAPVRTIVDIDLADYDRVWAAAGHPHTVFPTTYDELLQMTGGTAAVVA
jgi:prolyl-tRNA editing enzyme YbaK/EbsC (Cys-tRNA(Pro) deacylase)